MSDRRTMHAVVKPTGLPVEPTGVVEISIEALRVLAAAAEWELVEHSDSPDWTCDHGLSVSEHCSDCVGFNPATVSPACDWCAEPDCGFCKRQGA